MQDEQVTIRKQYIIEHMKEAWQDSPQPSLDDLQLITEFTTNLSEEYQRIGLETLGERLSN